VALADGDLIHRQDAKSVETRLAVMGFQVLFVDVLDRFPVQLEVPGHIADGHHGAQLVDGRRQPTGHPQIRVKEFQLLDADTLAMSAEQLAVITSQPHLGAGQVEVSYRALSPTVNVGGLLAAPMTHGMEALVRDHIDDGFGGIRVNHLFDDFDSTKGEVG
jgi:hypothetical protein